MDFQSAMETFAEAWVAANTQTALTEAAEAQQQQHQQTEGHQVIDGGVREGSPDNATTTTTNNNNNNGTDTDRPNRGHWHRHRYGDDHQAAHRHHQAASPGPGKSIPVHCVVRAPLGCCQQRPRHHHHHHHHQRGQRDSDSDSDSADVDSPCRHAHVELDSYVIIPSGTLLSELVRTALVKLGYTAPEARGARGAIRIRNWKSLPLDAITDDAEARVGDMLGELTAVATLSIRLRSRSEISSASDVKEKLLQLLLTQSQSLLASAGCPIDEKQLALISKGSSPSELPEDTRRRFDQWYVQQVVDQRSRLRTGHNHHHHHLLHLHSNNNERPEGGASMQLPPGTECEPCSALDSGGAPQPRSGAGDGETSAVNVHKTRMRTSFDPELELPQLHQWFSKNQHPTRLQIQNYVRELNTLESRRGRRMLTEQNVLYWFKNARAACKRAELRHVNGSSPGGQDHDSAASNDSSRAVPSAAVVIATPQRVTTTTTSAGAMDLSMSHQPSLIDEPVPPPPPPQPSNGHWEATAIKCEPGVGDNDQQVVGGDDRDEERAEDGDCACDCNCGDDLAATDSPQQPQSESPSEGQGQGHGQQGQGQGQGNPELTRSMLYMANYLPAAAAAAAAAINALDERRKRNRTFIDPVSEVPRLEEWFCCNTHPSHNLIVKYTDELNRMPYRQKFPKLESKNVQFWFKNRRAKSKRLRVCSS